jgi:hypothetical protein
MKRKALMEAHLAKNSVSLRNSLAFLKKVSGNITP